MQSAIDLVNQIIAVLAAVLLAPLTNGRTVVKVRTKVRHLVVEVLNLAIGDPTYAPKGKDPNALLAEWTLASTLRTLLSAISSARKSVGDTVLRKEAEVWDSVMTIYAVMQANAKHDLRVADLVAQMEAAMSPGPRHQKSVKTAIPPTPHSGKGARKALLATAKAEAGIPEATGGPVTVHPETPAVSNPSLSSTGNGGGAANGSGH